MGETAGRGEQEAHRLDRAVVPAWALQLIYRLGQLERGKAYNVTVMMVSDTPVWAVHTIGKVENGG